MLLVNAKTTMFESRESRPRYCREEISKQKLVDVAARMRRGSRSPALCRARAPAARRTGKWRETGKTYAIRVQQNI